MSEQNKGAAGGILAVLAAIAAGARGVADDGCRACARVASHGGDDVARLGSHSGGAFGHAGDDLARLGSRTSDDFAGAGLAHVGGAGDELGRFGAIGGELGFGVEPTERAVRTFGSDLPRRAARYQIPDPGVTAAVALRRSPRGVRLVAASKPELDGPLRFFHDYGVAAQRIGLDQGRHEHLLDVFLNLQDLAVEALTDDEPDEDIVARLTATAELALSEQLTVEERRTFEIVVGPPDVLVYRLATERPLTAQP